MYTICAYANDIAGVDGGYLVIGVKTEDGILVLKPEGLPQECLDDIAIKNIGILMFGGRLDKLIPKTKIELVRFHDKEAEASDFTEKTFYGPI